jgi:hypothetical protein
VSIDWTSFLIGFLAFPVAIVVLLAISNIFADRNNGCDADGP